MPFFFNEINFDNTVNVKNFTLSSNQLLIYVRLNGCKRQPFLLMW